MKTTKNVLNKLFIFGLLLAFAAAFFNGCATAPTAFESAASLAGTQWGRLADGGDLFEFHDAASGVYTGANGKEIPFTYTAPYDAEKRTFAGKITRADGAEWVVTVKRMLGLWSLWYENSNRQYLSPGQLQMWKDNNSQMVAFMEQYGEPYSDERLANGGLMTKTLKREKDGKQIAFIGHGRELGFYDGQEYPSLPYKLHSKDGVTITMKRNNLGNSGLSVGTSTVSPVGTFKVNIDKKEIAGKTRDGGPVYSYTLTISGGTGEGTQFNGVWVDE